MDQPMPWPPKIWIVIYAIEIEYVEENIVRKYVDCYAAHYTKSVSNSRGKSI
jgi:hypothetical protein